MTNEEMFKLFVVFSCFIVVCWIITLVVDWLVFSGVLPKSL